MKRKQFVKGITQIAQEGAIQIFQEFNSGMEEIIVGVVGVLQFDVLKYRLENEYNVKDLKKIVHGVGGKVVNEEKEIIIKHGWINKNILDNLKNFSLMSLVECEVQWNTETENKEKYNFNEKNLIEEKFKQVFYAKFNELKFDCIISIYDIAKIFENENYDITVVKNNYYSAFIEIISKDFEKNKEDIFNLIDTIKENPSVEKILNCAEFYGNWKNEIKFI